MSDSKALKGPRDGSRINMNEDYEVSYWTKTLKVSKEQLQQIVKKVGPLVQDIRNALKKNS
jgi:hypothetical protein